jgi:signal transduction histidine kinase
MNMLILAFYGMAIVVVLFWSSHQVGKGIRGIETASQIDRSAFMLRVLMKDYLDQGNERILHQWEQQHTRLGRILNDANLTRSLDAALLDEIKDKFRAVNLLYPRLIEMRAAADKGDTSQDGKSIKMLTALMFLQLEQLVHAGNDLSKAAQARTVRKRNFVGVMIVVAGVCAIAAVLVNVHYVRKAVVNPVLQLSSAAETVSAGSFELVPELETDDEVAKLTRAFNAMVTALRKRTNELEEAHRLMEQRVVERTKELQSAYDQLIVESKERRKAEEDVVAERKRLYDILETMPVMVSLLREYYEVVFANRSFREKMGDPDGRRCLENCFNRREPCKFSQTYDVLKTGAPHHWECTGMQGCVIDFYDFPFTDIDGSSLVMEVGIDITERKQAEEQLRRTLADLSRSNADLEQFAYVASHDLQEPLRNVTSCMQMLEKSYKHKLGEDADQYIHYSVESALRMKALIQGLLTYSRVGTKGKAPAPVNCEEALNEALENLRVAISNAGAVITHDPLPVLLADKGQLVQVFQNLIGNAVKFCTNKTPQVHVSAVKNDVAWTFSVADNGIGIEPRHFERIFVIFQRLHKRNAYEGTGMGLAIVKKIVERHHGKIWVDSEPEKGATFSFTIPLKESIS